MTWTCIQGSVQRVDEDLYLCRENSCLSWLNPLLLSVGCLSDLRYGARPSPLRVFTLMLSILWGQYLNYMGIEAWSFSKAVVKEISISFRCQCLLLEKGEYSALYVHAAGAILPALCYHWQELPQV